jgi:hypothetical protein
MEAKQAFGQQKNKAAALFVAGCVKQMVWLKYLRYQTNLAFWHHTHGLG